MAPPGPRRSPSLHEAPWPQEPLPLPPLPNTPFGLPAPPPPLPTHSLPNQGWFQGTPQIKHRDRSVQENNRKEMSRQDQRDVCGVRCTLLSQNPFLKSDLEKLNPDVDHCSQISMPSLRLPPRRPYPGQQTKGDFIVASFDTCTVCICQAAMCQAPKI